MKKYMMIGLFFLISGTMCCSQRSPFDGELFYSESSCDTNTASDKNQLQNYREFYSKSRARDFDKRRKRKRLNCGKKNKSNLSGAAQSASTCDGNDINFIVQQYTAIGLKHSLARYVRACECFTTFSDILFHISRSDDDVRVVNEAGERVEMLHQDCIKELLTVMASLRARIIPNEKSTNDLVRDINNVKQGFMRQMIQQTPKLNLFQELTRERIPIPLIPVVDDSGKNRLGFNPYQALNMLVDHRYNKLWIDQQQKEQEKI